MWILFNAALGALGGMFLAWGPLNGRYPLIFLFALLGGMAGGDLWLRQQTAVNLSTTFYTIQ